MRDRKSDSHRTVAARAAGRKLQPGEDVHHKDGNKANNATENLEPMEHGTHSAHTNRTRHTPLAKLRKALTMHQRGEKLY
jgi:hypothetical protein